MCTSSQKPYQVPILQKTQALNCKKELPLYPPAPATLVRPLLSSLGSNLKVTIEQRLRPPSQSLIQPESNPELLWGLRIISEKEMILQIGNELAASIPVCRRNPCDRWDQSSFPLFFRRSARCLHGICVYFIVFLWHFREIVLTK